MNWEISVFAAAALLVLAADPRFHLIGAARASTREASDRIDRPSAASARKKMPTAGFHRARDLKKGRGDF